MTPGVESDVGFNVSHHAGCDPAAAGSSGRLRSLWSFLIWFRFCLDVPPKVDMPRDMTRRGAQSSPLSDQLSEMA